MYLNELTVLILDPKFPGQISIVLTRGSFTTREPTRQAIYVCNEYCKTYKLNNVVALGLRFCLHGMLPALPCLATRVQHTCRKFYYLRLH